WRKKMHPAMIAWWKSHRSERHCGPHAGWGGGSGGWGEREGHETREAAGDDGFDGGYGAFGVRRPLRFLAYKLNLSDAQVSQLARILNDLKTERAQAAVDNRR